MEWNQLLTGALGSSLPTGLLAFAVFKLWTRMEARDAAQAKLIADKDEEIRDLNEARVDDLRQTRRPIG